MDLLPPCPAAQAHRLCDGLLSWATRHLLSISTPDRGIPSLVRAHITYTIGAEGVGALPVEAWKQGRVDPDGLTPLLSDTEAVALVRAEALDSQHAALAWLEHLRAGRDALAPLCAALLDAVPYLHTPRARIVLSLDTQRPTDLRAVFEAPGTQVGFPGIPGLDLTTRHRVDSPPTAESRSASPSFPVPLPRLLQRLSAFHPGDKAWVVRGGEIPRVVWARRAEEAILLACVCDTAATTHPLGMDATAMIDKHAMIEAYGALHRATS